MKLTAPYTAEKAAVLIVDDDVQANLPIARALSQRYQLHVAMHCVEAEDMLRFEYVQILLFNYQHDGAAAAIHFLNSGQAWSG
jgi:two-component system response regulator HupR/HoxA